MNKLIFTTATWVLLPLLSPDPVNIITITAWCERVKGSNLLHTKRHHRSSKWLCGAIRGQFQHMCRAADIHGNGYAAIFRFNCNKLQSRAAAAHLSASKEGEISLFVVLHYYWDVCFISSCFYTTSWRTHTYTHIHNMTRTQDNMTKSWHQQVIQ